MVTISGTPAGGSRFGIPVVAPILQPHGSVAQYRYQALANEEGCDREENPAEKLCQITLWITIRCDDPDREGSTLLAEKTCSSMADFV